MTATRRPECPDCGKALSRCYCRLVCPLQAGPKVVLLVHPREERSRGAVNTAHMVRRCVPDAELLVGRDFRHDRRLRELLGDPSLAPVLLYPDGEAFEGEGLQGRRPLLIVPDGTWLGTRQILRLSDDLARLPRLSLQVAGPSLYAFRRQPRPGCLCTLEAVHAALQALQPWSPSGPPEALEGMLEVLRHVVREQVELASGLREP